MRVRLLLVVLLAGALLLPETASAVIQIDRGIAGVRVGNSKAQVRAALGKPRRVRNGRNDFGPFTRYGYTREGITVIFQGGSRVSSVATTGQGDRTTRGVGVGSTEREVDAKVPRVKCETIVGTRSCHTGEFRAGRRITDFLIRRGRVRRVTVGIVVD
jgi:outer membrane protein assembly factor BamE (lipoprotein component of BamABCDE complex)